MIKEFRIPSPGESITEVEIAIWMVENGAYVEKNTELAEVESDKATLMLVAEESGKISIKVIAGQTVPVGTIAYTIDTDAQPEPGKTPKPPIKNANTTETQQSKSIEPTVTPASKDDLKITPIAAKIMEENNLSVDDIINGLKRISKQDVLNVVESTQKLEEKTTKRPMAVSRETERTKMSQLRKKLSERLVSVKNETAMLTTFNEIDMSAISAIRSKMQTRFSEKYGFKLGFMGFFTKAVSIAAMHYPMVNSQLIGDEIVTPSYTDVGIAVQTEKGLMVPIVRNAESKSVAQIEEEIKVLAQKARDKKISIDELSGGTISITNGGVFGSLLSTPLINPPQSAILGMHNIVDRPVALNGQVAIRPMMYVALSYDHRIIDGKDSVSFLKMVKELIENPERLAFEGHDPAAVLLGL
jgi:2-oxoglutarate dehydrogenase E2 component (dihydrolipoamide succinyltransferase)